MSLVTNLAIPEENKIDTDSSMFNRRHQQDAPLPISFYPQVIDQFLPPDLCEILKEKHDAILNAIPTAMSTPKGKPLYYKAALKKYVKHDIPSFLSRFRRNAYPENFQRTAHVEIDVPGVGPVSGYFNVFFDLYTLDNYIGGKCATWLDFKFKLGAVPPIKEVRWHAQEDKKLKEPRLYFNDLKYEEGDFFYTKLLGGFDLVIGWKTIQALRLLEPKKDIAAAGEGFRQLPRPVDLNIARLNQPAVAQIRDQEWERMRQHTERKAREAAAAAARQN